MTWEHAEDLPPYSGRARESLLKKVASKLKSKELAGGDAQPKDTAHLLWVGPCPTHLKALASYVLRVWLELWPLKKQLSQSELITGGPNPIWLLSLLDGEMSHIHRGKDMNWCRAKTMQGYGKKTSPARQRPQEKPTLLIPCCWNPIV